MEEVLLLVLKAAQTGFPAGSLWRNGTGKEPVAQRLHFASLAVRVSACHDHCAALAETLLRASFSSCGAFNGANRDRRGKLEEANGGTAGLSFDEVGDMSLTPCQTPARIDYGEISPVTGNEVRKISQRVVARRTSRWRKLAAEGRVPFRSLLQADGIEVDLPRSAAREREGGDLELLTEHFLKQAARKSGSRLAAIPPDAVALMKSCIHGRGRARIPPWNMRSRWRGRVFGRSEGFAGADSEGSGSRLPEPSPARRCFLRNQINPPAAARGTKRIERISRYLG